MPGDAVAAGGQRVALAGPRRLLPHQEGMAQLLNRPRRMKLRTFPGVSMLVHSRPTLI